MSDNKIAVYSLGFAFDKYFDNVILIQKNRPEWQAGKLNGVGGKFENFDKDTQHTQAREFGEETGIQTNPEDWKIFATMYSDIFIVDCFWTVLDDSFNTFTSVTDEVVHRVPVRDLYSFLTCPNVPLLISMALNGDVRSGKISKIPLNYVSWDFTS